MAEWQYYERVQLIDRLTGAADLAFGNGYGTAPGQFTDLRECCRGEDGNYYVLDANNISVFDEDGVYLTRWAIPNRARSIAYKDGELYILEYGYWMYYTGWFPGPHWEVGRGLGVYEPLTGTLIRRIQSLPYAPGNDMYLPGYYGSMSWQFIRPAERDGALWLLCAEWADSMGGQTTPNGGVFCWLIDGSANVIATNSTNYYQMQTALQGYMVTDSYGGGWYVSGCIGNGDYPWYLLPNGYRPAVYDARRRNAYFVDYVGQWDYTPAYMFPGIAYDPTADDLTVARWYSPYLTTANLLNRYDISSLNLVTHQMGAPAAQFGPIGWQLGKFGYPDPTRRVSAHYPHCRPFGVSGDQMIVLDYTYLPIIPEVRQLSAPRDPMTGYHHVVYVKDETVTYASSYWDYQFSAGVAIDEGTNPALIIMADGTLMVVYDNAPNYQLRKYSRDHGQTWTNS